MAEITIYGGEKSVHFEAFSENMEPCEDEGYVRVTPGKTYTLESWGYGQYYDISIYYSQNINNKTPNYDLTY